MPQVNVTIELVPTDEFGDADRHNQTVVEASADLIDAAIESARARAVAAAGAWNTVVARQEADDREGREQAERICKLEAEVRELREATVAARDAHKRGLAGLAGLAKRGPRQSTWGR